MPKRTSQAWSRRKGTPGIQTETILKCADNSGAQKLKMIASVGSQGTKRKQPNATLGDEIVATVKKGKPELRRQVVRAVIIRQKMPYRRANGQWIQFEDNAAVLIDTEGEPKGTETRGALAKEAAKRWPAVGKISTIIV